MMSVLIGSKDTPTLTVLSYHLERSGFFVNSGKNLDEFFKSIDRLEPLIIALDEEIIVGDILENVIKNIRNKTKKTHIILLAKQQPIESVGVDDYLLKPFSLSELLVKIKSYKIQPSVSANSARVLNYNDIQMYVDSYRVTRDGREIHLGPTEFKILQCFLEIPEKVLSRDHILTHVWGHGTDIDPRTIDVHINRLRSALKEESDDMSIIRTIRSAGYSLNIMKKLARA
jgi:two-component system phosphate regulon response regulator PhoB